MAENYLDTIMPLICNHLDCSDSHGQQYPDCRDSCVTGGHLYKFIKREFILKSEIDELEVSNEDFEKCGNSGERGRCKERAEWVWSHEPNQTDRLSLCTEHKEKAERDSLQFGYFRRI